MRLILASQSPRRAELLGAAGFEFTVQTVDVDESLRPGESPRDYVARLASEKSAAGLAALADPADVSVLGADTVVVNGRDILGKPRDAEDAARMLRRLSGRTHQVFTGVSARTAGEELSAVEMTAVTFVPLSEDQIAWYVASGEGSDKAGAYAIQGLASRFVTKIEGSYSNVVGLPVATVEQLITRLERGAGILASRR